MNTRESFNIVAKALQNGDRHAAELIFDHFAQPLHGFFMIRTGHRETAQDLTQEVFIKVIKNIDQFDEEAGNFTAWIWQIARNSLIDFFRQKKPGYLEDLPDGGELIEERSGIQESAYLREVMNVVRDLTQEDQELFELHFVADMAYGELADVTGKSESALRIAVYRLRKKLKEQIHD